MWYVENISIIYISKYGNNISIPLFHMISRNLLNTFFFRKKHAYYNYKLL